MSAELKLTLASSEQPELAGWWVAAGSSCPEHEVGVLIIVSPAEAARIKAGGSSPAMLRARLMCAAQMFARAAQQVSGVTVAVAQIPQPPNNPRTS